MLLIPATHFKLGSFQEPSWNTQARKAIHVYQHLQDSTVMFVCVLHFILLDNSRWDSHCYSFQISFHFRFPCVTAAAILANAVETEPGPPSTKKRLYSFIVSYHEGSTNLKIASTHWKCYPFDFVESCNRWRVVTSSSPPC